MSTGTISGRNRIVLGGWMILFIGILIAMLRADFNGNGLRNTQVYLVLGVAIYPLFYGLLCFALVKFTELFLKSEKFIWLDGAELRIGAAAIPVRDITGVNVRNRGLLSKIVISRRDGTTRSISAIALSRSPQEVQMRIKEAAGIR